MDDTTPEITKKMRDLYTLKSPQERLNMGCSMIAASRYLVTQSILAKHPNISKSDLRKEIFLRFYGNDFDAEKREKILRYLVEPRNGS